MERKKSAKIWEEYEKGTDMREKSMKVDDAFVL